MYKVSFFVPESASEVVKTAMFNAGAGKIGNYDRCSFETIGSGQFRALAGANPSVGCVGELEKVRELKVEMVCEDNVIKEVVLALKKHHPYEMPAYEIIKLAEF
ncbi:MAG: NGG1p interacting factor NIF3 [Bacteriovorax sp.]|nr:NGG1p interacting factor NIF3 [Bacteriovorax sp.]